MAKVGGMKEIGVPVKGAVVVGPIPGKDSAGKPCLYAVAGQEAGDKGGVFILQIDIETGACRRFDAPVRAAGARPSFWSDRWQCLFIGASGREHHAVKESGWLLRFDPRKEQVENLGLVHPGRNPFPVGIAEAADGSIYIGCCPDCTLYRWDPASGKIARCGQADESEYYAYPACGDDGTVAVVPRMMRPRVVLYDPATGDFKSVGPVADTQAQKGFIDLCKGADGLLYLNSHEGWFQISGMEARPVKDEPRRPAQVTLPDGSTFRFIGQQPPRVIEIRRPDGTQKSLRLNYDGEGVEIYLVRPAPNGKLYGSSVLPLHFFEYEPKKLTPR